MHNVRSLYNYYKPSKYADRRPQLLSQALAAVEALEEIVSQSPECISLLCRKINGPDLQQ